MIVKCTCTHTFQDKKYGKGSRVANLTAGNKDSKKARCTVCGTVK